MWRIEPDMLAEPSVGNEGFQAETEWSLFQKKEILVHNDNL